MTVRSPRPRFLPARPFPAYAYLPGRQPHPVRDPAGHSYRAGPEHGTHSTAGKEAEHLYWGIDLFNHGYYWEAHEAWEDLWFEAEHDSPLRLALKGLILLAAAGVKIREGKRAAAGKHARRAAALFGAAAEKPHPDLLRELGMPLEGLSAEAKRIAGSVPVSPTSEQPRPVFDFVLGGQGIEGRNRACLRRPAPS
jgi:hypothetical protein